MTLWLITALLLKHFICDFPLQAFPFQYRNKGKWGHPGGMLHAGIHTAGTMLALIACGVSNEGFILACAFGDGVAHYHIDWAKMNINARMGWKPDNSEWFWILLGLDQPAARAHLRRHRGDPFIAPSAMQTCLRNAPIAQWQSSALVTRRSRFDSE